LIQLTDHRVLPKIEVGNAVFAKHKNGRYYKCHVVETKMQMFCEMDFEDGSYSDNMYPEDIEVCCKWIYRLIGLSQPI